MVGSCDAATCKANDLLLTTNGLAALAPGKFGIPFGLGEMTLINNGRCKPEPCSWDCFLDFCLRSTRYSMRGSKSGGS